MKGLRRGLRIVQGKYVQVRIIHKGQYHHKNFGADCPLARELADEYLSEKRREILKGRFGIRGELPQRKFAETALLFSKRWAAETNADGKLKHGPRSIYENQRILDVSLIPYFGNMWVDEIRPLDIMKWRNSRLKKVLGTSVNREQAVLSAFFGRLEKWTALELIAAFRLPIEPQTGKIWNPCRSVEMAETRKRERIVTPYEISKLKNAARELGDENGRDNICLIVKTCLSLKDVKTLKFGDTVDLNRSKTGVRVIVPIVVMHTPDWTNWRKRFAAIRRKAGILDITTRDLRTAGGNLLLGRNKYELKWISQYLGHASVKTTESAYTKILTENMSAMAQDLSAVVDGL